MRRNPANESVVEFVVTVRNSMLAAAEVMGAAETAVGKGYAKDFTVRVISEGASPSLGIRFIYDSSDNVLDREGKITRILEKAGGHVAGSSHARRNPEGERHTSLKEQAESALLWERIRNAKSQKEALAHYRAALIAAEGEQRLLRDRKKAGKGRKPKALYTKEYLAEKGMPRRNPPLSQQQQRKLMQALESDARSLSDIGNRPVGAMQFALFDENGNRMINWTYDMVGGSQEEPVLGMRPHPMWVIAPYAVGDEFDSMGYRYRVTAPNRAIRFARIRPKYYWDREGEQVLIPLGPPMKKNGRGRGR